MNISSSSRFTFYSGSGATCMAHIDGTDQENGISPLISRIQEVSLGYPNGRLELHLVGGYVDPRGYSERLVINLLRKFIANTIYINRRYNIVLLSNRCIS